VLCTPLLFSDIWYIFAIEKKYPHHLSDQIAGMKHISTYELKEKMDRNDVIQLIDTRESEKFLESHLPGAINIPQIDLPDLVHMISKEMPVIMYCLYGVKSQAPYLYLTEKMKFKNIFILEGGIYQWQTDIDPTLQIG